MGYIMDDINSKNDVRRSYILITPAKNEDMYIGQCIKSVASQSIIPIVWVIVDDGSTDKTPEIIQESMIKYPWIQNIQLIEGCRDLTIHVAHVVKTGIDFAVKYCKENDIKYDYICTIDADMIIPNKDFFEKIIIEFEKDGQLGIASCRQQYINNFGALCENVFRENTISGGGMVCRRTCFEDIGGYYITYSPDSILGVKALLKGWGVKRFNEIKIIQMRETSSAEGLKKGYIIRGASAHYLNTNPLFVVLKAFNYCLRRPHYIGFAYLYGYFNSLIKRKEQISDHEIRDYYYWQKPCEMLQYYLNKFVTRN